MALSISEWRKRGGPAKALLPVAPVDETLREAASNSSKASKFAQEAQQTAAGALGQIRRAQDKLTEALKELKEESAKFSGSRQTLEHETSSARMLIAAVETAERRLAILVQSAETKAREDAVRMGAVTADVQAALEQARVALGKSEALREQIDSASTKADAATLSAAQALAREFPDFVIGMELDGDNLVEVYRSGAKKNLGQVRFKPPKRRKIQGGGGAATPLVYRAQLIVKTVTTDYTMLPEDDVILADSSAGQITITTVDPHAWRNRPKVIKRIGTGNSVLVQSPAGSFIKLIDKLPRINLDDDLDGIEIISDEVNWYII